jgi:hypothetical protein
MKSDVSGRDQRRLNKVVRSAVAKGEVLFAHLLAVGANIAHRFSNSKREL